MDWSTFFDMGGRGFYVWGAYGVTLIVMFAECWLLRQRTRTLARRSGQT